MGRKVSVHYAKGWFKGTIGSISNNEAIINFDNGDVEGVDFPFDKELVKYLDDEKIPPNLKKGTGSKMSEEHKSKISEALKKAHAAKASSKKKKS